MTKVILIKVMHSDLKVREHHELPIATALEADIVLGAIGSGPLRRRFHWETTGTVSLSPFCVKESLSSKEGREAVAAIGDDALRAAMRGLAKTCRDHWSPARFIALATARDA